MLNTYEVGIRWEKSRRLIQAKNATEAKRIYCRQRGRNPNDPWTGIGIVTARKVKGGEKAE